MTISAERHKEIFYWLDDPYKYDQQPIDSDSADESPYDAPTYGELRTLLHDSARLERIEREVRELAEWQDAPTQMKLRAIVDTESDK